MARNLSVRLYANMVSNYSRGILRGIADYIKIHGGWDFSFCCSIAPDFPASWRREAINGAIMQIHQRDQAQALFDSGIPAVNVSNVLRPPAALASVFCDDVAVGKMAARYYRQRGFQHFAFVGTRNQFSLLRQDGFTKGLQGHCCEIFHGEGIEDIPGKMALLASLPRPLAIFCCNDTAAREVLRQVVALGLQVPDDIAVLGVDNDEINCMLSGVQLSSIRGNAERVGYEAAEMLARLMAGQPAPTAPMLIGPAEVITRRSTDVLALGDPEVAAAFRFIRDCCGEKINVRDLLARTRLSRRSLEMRFRKALGRSPYQEIRRVQVERATMMLSRTSRPLREIADACGFKEARQMSTAIHEQFGLTPRQYRRRARTDPGAPGPESRPAPPDAYQ